MQAKTKTGTLSHSFKYHLDTKLKRAIPRLLAPAWLSKLFPFLKSLFPTYLSPYLLVHPSSLLSPCWWYIHSLSLFFSPSLGLLNFISSYPLVSYYSYTGSPPFDFLIFIYNKPSHLSLHFCSIGLVSFFHLLQSLFFSLQTSKKSKTWSLH